MLYLLCMLAGCRLLKGRCYALAVTRFVYCAVVLLAMLVEKLIYAIIVLAAYEAVFAKRKRMAWSASAGRIAPPRLIDQHLYL